MGFRKSVTTTGKVEMSDALKEDVALSFYYDIVYKVKRHNTLLLLTINLDQKLSKFVSGSKAMQTTIWSTTVPITGIKEKNLITLTFVITLNGTFLSMQAIYKGKATRCFL